MSARAVPPWRRVAPAALALLLLNGLLGFNNVWPTPAIMPDHRLAPEFVGLWLGLLIAAARGAPSPRVLAGFTVVFMLLVLGRYGDVTVPALFGRPVNLYWDGQQIPRFLWVSAQSLPAWMSAAAVAAVVLLAYAIYRLFGMLIRIAARDAAPYALRTRWAQVVTVLAVLLVAANIAGVRATWPVVSRPIVPTYWRQATLLTTIFTGQGVAQILPRADALDAALAAPPGSALAGLRGSDVYLMPLESYGAVAYDNPEAAARLRPARERLAADLAAGGFSVVSAFMRSPTFGGASDLAQLGMLSGLDLTDPLRHDLLLTTDRPTLITLFRANGYRTFGFYPALFWDWPERVFYGYDHFVDGRDLDYPGPEFGYWKIPDQYAAARFEQLFPRRVDSPPRFVFFPTITCHLPFSPVPPYQADPQKLLGDTPFDPADSARALAVKPDWLNMFPDYLAIVEYTYRWLGDYLRQPQQRDTIYILVGDHQPAANVSGEGASWDVPVHIVSRDPELLARFTAQGFHAGLEPPREARGGLHDLTTMMLRAFAQP
ncbi:sulfatase family protein [Methyloversatilis sp. RAC08]|uniref:sulfatase-like hydrolase/transferase n=1 Tax=Methyloversatilis sp. RAC08 TaxID=1842540 RepID=UPI00083E13E1|nr:sulfatase-like hydrolase/transferase [Methyloversatilis sp. RAC08]AOF81083.1 sulfatase family protein [Methyloversatilis sp. RAC08]